MGAVDPPLGTAKIVLPVNDYAPLRAAFWAMLLDFPSAYQAFRKRITLPNLPFNSLPHLHFAFR